MSRSVFEKIVAGELPCHRLYEDGHCLAFLDVGPVSRGHCLLIPKVRYVELDDVPPEVAAALGAAMPRLVAAVKSATGCVGLNLLQNNGAEAGQVVMHVHFHLIPRYAPPPPEARPGGAGLDYDWPAGSLDPDDAADLVGRITAALTER
ncbi:MAG: HIT family protein [Planctomycetota bacterium]